MAGGSATLGSPDAFSAEAGLFRSTKFVTKALGFGAEVVFRARIVFGAFGIDLASISKAKPQR